MRKSWPNEGAPAAASSLPFQSPRLVAAVAALYWVVSSFVAMRVPVAIVTLLSMVVIGCGPTQRVRMQPSALRELQSIHEYSSGDIQAARQSLLDYIHLIEEEEASGLPFTKTAYSTALAAARLTLIYRELSE